MGGDSQSTMQRADHAEAERAFVVEDFGNTIFSREVFFEVFLPEPLLLHAKADGLDGVWKADRVVLLLVTLDQQGPEFQLLLLFGSGLCIHERIDLCQGGAVFSFGFQDFGLHAESFRWWQRRFCHTGHGFRHSG